MLTTGTIQITVNPVACPCCGRCRHCGQQAAPAYPYVQPWPVPLAPYDPVYPSYPVTVTAPIWMIDPRGTQVVC